MIELSDFVDIKGYEGRYAISKNGMVLSYKKGKFLNHKILKQKSLCMGYRFFRFRIDGKYKSHYLHRLLAMMFLPNWDSKLQVNHKDGDKLNNDLSNLEMVTIIENNNHALKNGLINNRGEKCGTSKLTLKDAEFIREVYHSGFCLQKEIAAYFKVGKLAINRIINNHSFKVETYEHE